MKTSPPPSGRDTVAAFTLVEVLVVITIIGVLFGLVLALFQISNNAQKQRETQLSLTAVASALSSYQKDVGSFPEPARPAETAEVAGKTYEVGGGTMLYQALSGDGNDRIRIASDEPPRSSNGNLDEEEAKLVYLKSSPKAWSSIKASFTTWLTGGAGPFSTSKRLTSTPSSILTTQAAHPIRSPSTTLSTSGPTAATRKTPPPALWTPSTTPHSRRTPAGGLRTGIASTAMRQFFAKRLIFSVENFLGRSKVPSPALAHALVAELVDALDSGSSE